MTRLQKSTQPKSAILALLMSCGLCGCAGMTPMQRTAVVASGLAVGGLVVAASFRSSPYVPAAGDAADRLILGPSLGMGALLMGSAYLRFGAAGGSGRGEGLRVEPGLSFGDAGHRGGNFRSAPGQGLNDGEASIDRSPESIPYAVDTKKTERLVSSYHEYLTQFPRDQRAWEEAGDLYLQLGRKADAETCFKWARSLDASGSKKLYQGPGN